MDLGLEYLVRTSIWPFERSEGVVGVRHDERGRGAVGAKEEQEREE